jgi:hypothetical protein
MIYEIFVITVLVFGFVLNGFLNQIYRGKNREAWLTRRIELLEKNRIVFIAPSLKGGNSHQRRLARRSMARAAKLGIA